MSNMKGGELAGAYVVAGSATMLAALKQWLSEHGVQVDGNPDVYVREYKQFVVDDAREVRDRAQARGVGGPRVFIIVAPNMTTEAQNALLKTIEEPPAGARFFFVVPSPQALLPTVRSRAQVLNLASAESDLDISTFLAATAEKRLDMMKPLYSHDEDDERDVRGAVAFLSSLEEELGKRPKEDGVQKGLEAVYRARKYMMDKGSLLKTLLEQVALLVPKL
jgi:DNA polymerase III delta prime subunit